MYLFIENLLCVSRVVTDTVLRLLDMNIIFPRYKLRLYSILFVVILLSGCGQEQEVSGVSTEPPNVLFILVDTLRPDHLGTYGYTRKTSPNIDRLADEGVKFNKAFAQSPWTAPSISSIFTSLHPSASGVIKIANLTMHTLRDNYITLAELLSGNDYDTAAFISNPWLSKNMKFDQGFDTYDMFEWNKAPLITNAAFDWLDNKSSSKPFFVYMHYMDVHCPYNEIPAPYNELFPEGSDDLYLRTVITDEQKKGHPNICWKVGVDHSLNYFITKYDQEIRYVDDEIGKIISKLKDSGNLENTLIVIASDHGLQFLDHGGWGKGETLYNENLHVPMVLRLPGRLPKGKEINTLVRNIDLMPTILNLLNIPLEHQVQGVDLTPLIKKGRKISVSAFSEELDLEVDLSRTIKSLRTDKYALILNTKTYEAEFYDAKSDPKEGDDLLKKPEPDVSKNADLSMELSEVMHFIMEENISILNKHLSEEEEETPELDEQMQKKLKSLGYLQ